MLVKSALITTGLMAVILFCSGCEDGLKKPGGSVRTNDSQGNFPDVMVGVWETERASATGQKWGIKFEPDGTVKKIIHNLAGPINLSEGGALIEGGKEDEFAIFKVAPCQVKYNEKTRMLEIVISVENYVIQKPNFTLEGRITDKFSGIVSKDGKTWKTERRTFGILEGAETVSEEFANANPDEVVFNKIALK